MVPRLWAQVAGGDDDTVATTVVKERAARTCTSAQEEDPCSDHQMQHILTKLREYQSKRYQCTARCRAVPAAGDTNNSKCWTLHTYCEHMDAHNRVAGAWSGTWQLELQTEQTATLAAELQWHAHAAEGANVQTRSTRRYEPKTVSTATEVVHSIVAKFEHSKLSYEEQLANAVVAQMVEWEKQFAEALSSSLNNDTVEGLVKPLRRILPVTKTRFKWDSAAHQRSVQLLHARQQKQNK